MLSSRLTTALSNTKDTATPNRRLRPNCIGAFKVVIRSLQLGALPKIFALMSLMQCANIHNNVFYFLRWSYRFLFDVISIEYDL